MYRIHNMDVPQTANLHTHTHTLTSRCFETLTAATSFKQMNSTEKGRVCSFALNIIWPMVKARSEMAIKYGALLQSIEKERRDR